MISIIYRYIAIFDLPVCMYVCTGMVFLLLFLVTYWYCFLCRWDQQHLLRPSFREIVEILNPFYNDLPEFSAMEAAPADLLDDLMGGK